MKRTRATGPPQGANAPSGGSEPRAAGSVGARSCGFTLIEVMVALGIVAIALTAGLQATTALTNNALRQSDVLLAHICAENELVKVRLAKQMPGVGESDIA